VAIPFSNGRSGEQQCRPGLNSRKHRFSEYFQVIHPWLFVVPPFILAWIYMEYQRILQITAQEWIILLLAALTTDGYPFITF